MFFELYILYRDRKTTGISFFGHFDASPFNNKISKCPTNEGIVNRTDG